MEIEYQVAMQGDVLEDFYLDRTEKSMIMGPLGSGKTTTSCHKLFDLICEQEPNEENVRPTRVVCIRNTASDLSGTTIKDWLEMYGDLGRFVQGGKEPPTHYVHFELDDGTSVKSEIIFLALDRPDAVKKLRGYQVTWFWLNEAKELNKAIVDMADGRHGRYPSQVLGGVDCGRHGMIGDYNAPDEDDWIYELAEEHVLPDWKFFKQPGGVLWEEATKTWLPNLKAENYSNLPERYYEKLLQGKSHDWIKVNLANEYGFAIDGKPVHPAYQDSIHCRPCKPEQGFPIEFGIDFGLTPAVTFGQKVNGQWRVFKEMVTDHVSAEEFAPLLRDELNQLRARGFDLINTGAGDPSGNNGNQTTKKTPFDVLFAHGIDAAPAPGNNDPLLRRKALSQHFLRNTMAGEPGIIIDPSCVTLRKGLAGKFNYKRVKVSGDERYRDEPDKNFWSHVCEACEYMMLGAGEGDAVVNPPERQPGRRRVRVKRSLR